MKRLPKFRTNSVVQTNAIVDRLSVIYRSFPDRDEAGRKIALDMQYDEAATIRQIKSGLNKYTPGLATALEVYLNTAWQFDGLYFDLALNSIYRHTLFSTKLNRRGYFNWGCIANEGCVAMLYVGAYAFYKVREDTNEYISGYKWLDKRVEVIYAIHYDGNRFTVTPRFNGKPRVNLPEKDRRQFTKKELQEASAVC